jgi:hypothetical protein
MPKKIVYPPASRRSARLNSATVDDPHFPDALQDERAVGDDPVVKDDDSYDPDRPRPSIKETLALLLQPSYLVYNNTEEPNYDDNNAVDDVKLTI